MVEYMMGRASASVPRNFSCGTDSSALTAGTRAIARNIPRGRMIRSLNQKGNQEQGTIPPIQGGTFYQALLRVFLSGDPFHSRATSQESPARQGFDRVTNDSSRRLAKRVPDGYRSPY